jgi:hypothetical protein
LIFSKCERPRSSIPFGEHTFDANLESCPFNVSLITRSRAYKSYSKPNSKTKGFKSAVLYCCWCQLARDVASSPCPDELHHYSQSSTCLPSGSRTIPSAGLVKFQTKNSVFGCFRVEKQRMIISTGCQIERLQEV